MTADDIRRLCDQVYDVLMLSETPPHAQGGGSGQAGSRPPIPVGFLDAKVALHHTISSWALLISEEGEFVIDCDGDTMGITGWIYTKADWLAGHPACEDFITEVTEAMRRVRGFYRPVRDDRRYLGEHQGVRIYAQPGQETVEIPGMGMQRVETVRDWVRHGLLTEPMSAYDVADYITNELGMHVTANRIVQMVRDDRRRNRTEPLIPAQEHPMLFRICDVVTRMQSSRKVKSNALS